jgi:serine/threonine-protein kinase
VAAAHAEGIFHRDLKPENIFLAQSPDGLAPTPKVLDFGVAKLSADIESTALSVTSSLMGTYQYMAPEQLRVARDVDQRADVYALGAVLYQMITGNLPYNAQNPVDLALQILQSEAPSMTTHVPNLPAGLASVVARALTRDRDLRYQTLDEFALELEPFAGGLRFRGQGEAPVLPVRVPAPEAAPSSSSSRSDVKSRPASVHPELGPPLHTPFLASKRIQAEPKAARGLLRVGIAAVVVIGAASWGALRYAGGDPAVAPPAAEPAHAAASAGPGLPPSPQPALAVPVKGEPVKAADPAADWNVARDGGVAAPTQLEPDPAEPSRLAPESTPATSAHDKHHHRAHDDASRAHTHGGAQNPAAPSHAKPGGAAAPQQPANGADPKGDHRAGKPQVEDFL